MELNLLKYFSKGVIHVQAETLGMKRSSLKDEHVRWEQHKTSDRWACVELEKMKRSVKQRNDDSGDVGSKQLMKLSICWIRKL